MRADRYFAFSGLYSVEPLSDATCLREALRRRQGTPLEDFFSILLVCLLTAFNTCLALV